MSTSRRLALQFAVVFASLCGQSSVRAACDKKYDINLNGTEWTQIQFTGIPLEAFPIAAYYCDSTAVAYGVLGAVANYKDGSGATMTAKVYTSVYEELNGNIPDLLDPGSFVPTLDCFIQDKKLLSISESGSLYSFAMGPGSIPIEPGLPIGGIWHGKRVTGTVSYCGDQIIESDKYTIIEFPMTLGASILAAESFGDVKETWGKVRASLTGTIGTEEVTGLVDSVESETVIPSMQDFDIHRVVQIALSPGLNEIPIRLVAEVTIEAQARSAGLAGLLPGSAMAMIQMPGSITVGFPTGENGQPLPDGLFIYDANDTLVYADTRVIHPCCQGDVCAMLDSVDCAESGGAWIVDADDCNSGLCVDSDADGYLGYLDNCPDASNADQSDTDDDGYGDICDPPCVFNDSTLIPYGGWSSPFEIYAHGDVPVDVHRFEFEDTSFQIGMAPFASWVGCGWSMANEWPPNTELVLRKWLTGCITNLRIGVAIDNGVRVFVNEYEVTQGFANSENCAVRDRFVFSVPDSLLMPDSNFLVIWAEDHGAMSFLDIRVIADVGIPFNPTFAPHQFSIVAESGHPVAFESILQLDDSQSECKDAAWFTRSARGLVMTIPDSGRGVTGDLLLIVNSPAVDSGVSHDTLWFFSLDCKSSPMAVPITIKHSPSLARPPFACYSVENSLDLVVDGDTIDVELRQAETFEVICHQELLTASLWASDPATTTFQAFAVLDATDSVGCGGGFSFALKPCGLDICRPGPEPFTLWINGEQIPLINPDSVDCEQCDPATKRVAVTCPADTVFIVLDSPGPVQIPVSADGEISFAVGNADWDGQILTFDADSSGVYEFLPTSFGECGYSQCRVTVKVEITSSGCDSICGTVYRADCLVKTECHVSDATVELWDSYPDGVLISSTTTVDGHFCFDVEPGVEYDIRLYAKAPEIPGQRFVGWCTKVVEDLQCEDGPLEIELSPIPFTPLPNWPYFTDYYSSDAMFVSGEIPYLIQPGDVIYATDPDGVICGITCVEADSAGAYLIHVLGDDIKTPEDEGAEPGDSITLWLNCECPVVAPDTWLNFGSYQFDALWDCENPELCCVLCEGWNMWSYNRVLPDYAREAVLATIDLNYDAVRSGLCDYGSISWFANRPINDLTDVTPYFGYDLHMLEADTICIAGEPIDPQTPIYLCEGWNYIPYLPEESDNLSNALQSLAGNYIHIFTMYCDYGVASWNEAREPQNNDLSCMEPCKGYWIKMKSDDTLIYPENTQGCNFAAKVGSSSSSGRVTATPMVADYYAGSSNLNAGDVISARNSAGTLIGETWVGNNGAFLLHVYGDVPQTPEIEGAVYGEELTFQVNGLAASAGSSILWTDRDNQAINLTVDEAGAVPTEYSLLQNYPNPFNAGTVIPFVMKNASQWSLTVYNIMGQTVRTFAGSGQAGLTTVQWDTRDDNGSEVASGVYFYRLTTPEWTGERKMTLLR